MEKFKKAKKILRWVLLGACIILVVAAVCFKIYTRNYYRADSTYIESYEADFNGAVHTYSNKDASVFIPTGEEAGAVIVFYPGGKVQHTAYSALMCELASRGYICILPRMPENLAFLNIGAADKLLDGMDAEKEMAKDLDWYLAGHSLGGVAASVYLGDNVDNYAGIILCASYTTTDFSGTDLRLLSIYGDQDKVLNMDGYNESKPLWPADSEEYVIEGGIHSYFGSYGMQEGDGEPAITNGQQIRQTADIISNWIG